MRKILAVVGVLIVGVAPVYAAETETSAPEGGFGFVAEIGFEFGGDKVAEVGLRDAVTNETSSENIKAGDGFAFAVGAHYRPPSWAVDFSGTVGYKVDDTSASDARIRVSRTTVELLAHFDPKESWWIAGGLVWHNGVKFDADGFGQNINMGSATGFTLQAGWKWIALKYTDMEYTEKSTGRNLKIDGSSVGIVLRWRG